MPEIPRALTAHIVALAILVAVGLWAVRIGAQGLPMTRDLAVRPDFAEPVTLTSKDGVLEVTLTPRQSTASLNTVAKPVKNMLLFDYSVQRGTASDGQMSGGHQYPAPTLQVATGRETDRSHQQRVAQPDDPRFLRPEVYAQGPEGTAVPYDDDVGAVQPARARRARQPAR
jgi:hypothetical protein